MIFFFKICSDIYVTDCDNTGQQLLNLVDEVFQISWLFQG